MEGPKNVTEGVAAERGHLAFAKVMERIVKEVEGDRPDPALLEALASCGHAASSFETSE